MRPLWIDGEDGVLHEPIRKVIVDEEVEVERRALLLDDESIPNDDDNSFS